MSEALEPLNDTWLNGKPYYCDECGLGFGEYSVCEEGHCRLETPTSAQKRLAREYLKRP